VIVGEGALKKQGIVYITHPLVYRGFGYYNDKEGYSLLLILYDREGNELYGAHIPLQSLKQKDDSYRYTTGTREGPGSFAYPQDPQEPLYALQVAYLPTQFKERAGNAVLQVWPFTQEHPKQGDKPIAAGKVRVGERFKVGDHSLLVAEVRYWVAMSVRYEPGKPIVLASLWMGLAGMITTFIGRMMKRSAQHSAVS
jgi:hypothetical protein